MPWPYRNLWQYVKDQLVSYVADIKIIVQKRELASRKLISATALENHGPSPEFQI